MAGPKPMRKGGAAGAESSILDGGLSPGAVEEMKKNGQKLTGLKAGGGGGSSATSAKPAGKPPKSKKQGKADGVLVRIYQKGEGTKPLTVEDAMELIGWTLVEEGPFQLHDVHGNKIRLASNSTNRPFRPGIYERYMNEILRDKWSLNGETIIFDWDGKCQSGQHRLVAFIMAEETRREQKERWAKYHKGTITLECIVVHGIDPSPEVVDTIDQGQKRTIGDVFFRGEVFGHGSRPLSLGEGKDTIELPAMGDKLRQKLCNIAAGAARLVWLRAGGRVVSDAPHFPVSEAVDFIKDHPGLLYSVAFINGLEGGDSKDGHKLSRFLTLGYASALFYLMATSSTDAEEFLEQGPSALDFKLKKKAQEFWGKFASGAELKADDPIFVLRELLPRIEAGSAVGRDEIVATIIRGFNAFMDNKKVKSKDLVVRKAKDENGKERLVDEPRLGGLDIEGPEKPEEVTEADDASDDREGSRSSKKGWSEGDTCWVKGQEGDNWFGTIREVIKADGGDIAEIEADDGQLWEEKVSRLSLKYPG